MEQRKTPDDGQRNCPKHVEFLDKNKFGKLVRLLVLLKRKLVTMHGHMNVKSSHIVRMPSFYPKKKKAYLPNILHFS